MRIAAFDTTSRAGSIALLDSGALIADIGIDSPDGFSHILFGALQELLALHAWAIDSIDAIASAAGPGSFTGVRVSLAAAKGLGESLGKPVIAISNLKAIASLGTQAIRATWIDARRGEVFGGVYSDTLALIAAETVAPFDTWLASLPAGAEVIAGEGRRLAAPIARIAWTQLQQGAPMDSAGIDANYVRRSDAELFWKDPATS